jgi:hypothetical protein
MRGPQHLGIPDLTRTYPRSYRLKEAYRVYGNASDFPVNLYLPFIQWQVPEELTAQQRADLYRGIHAYTKTLLNAHFARQQGTGKCGSDDLYLNYVRNLVLTFFNNACVHYTTKPWVLVSAYKCNFPIWLLHADLDRIGLHVPIDAASFCSRIIEWCRCKRMKMKYDDFITYLNPNVSYKLAHRRLAQYMYIEYMLREACPDAHVGMPKIISLDGIDYVDPETEGGVEYDIDMGAIKQRVRRPQWLS